MLKRFLLPFAFFVVASVSCATYLPQAVGSRTYKINPYFKEGSDYVVLGEVDYQGRSGTRGFIEEARRLYPDAEALVDCYADMVYDGSWGANASYFHGWAVKSSARTADQADVQE